MNGEDYLVIKMNGDGVVYQMNRLMAEQIRRQRIKCGLTQSELAEKSGTTSLKISQIETGRINRITSGQLIRIEAALGLEAGEIAAMEDSPPLVADMDPYYGDFEMKFCYKCGVKLFHGSVFCHRCGEKLPRPENQ